MRVDREQLIKAIRFLKPAILVSDRLEPLGFVHVQIDEGKAILTAADHYVAKRVVLLPPQQIDIEMEYQEFTNESFMIPKSTLEAFETLCAKHKTKFEQPAKGDASLKIVEIGATELISHKDTIQYEQPGISYPIAEVSQLFGIPAEATEELMIFPDVVQSAFKEFPDKSVLTITMSRGGIVHIADAEGYYQSVFKTLENRNVQD